MPRDKVDLRWWPRASTDENILSTLVYGSRPVATVVLDQTSDRMRHLLYVHSLGGGTRFISTYTSDGAARYFAEEWWEDERSTLKEVDEGPVEDFEMDTEKVGSFTHLRGRGVAAVRSASSKRERERRCSCGPDEECPRCPSRW